MLRCSFQLAYFKSFSSCIELKQDYALKVIAETNESWAKLVKRSIPAVELSLA